MYFDLELKSNIRDLYDIEQPFEKLTNMLKDRRA